MTNIAIFASGTGSNADKLIAYFQHLSSSKMKISLVISNNPNAKVLEKAKKANIETAIFSNNDFEEATPIVEYLKTKNIKWIVLAGFLRKISPNLLQAFPNRIINIHPSLLPKYGGKGMYGINVHKAVVAAGEKESGITIHVIDEEYDKGKILHQKSCAITPSDTPEDVAKKVLELEHQYFAKVVEETINRYQDED